MDDEFGRPALRFHRSGASVFALPLRVEAASLFGRLSVGASPGRRERASRYRVEADAIRCLAAEALLFDALEATCGIDRTAVRFSTTPSGKPCLVSHPSVQFNLSHSGSWVMCALHTRPVGVDVEQPRPTGVPAAEQFMSPAELACYGASPPDERRGVYFRLWTLKESVLKAAGTGFAFDPRRMTVSLDVDPVTVSEAPGAAPGSRWQPYELPMPSGAFAAVCVEEPLR
jgi:4'-phosphopantetheinyl transferase